LDLGIARDDRRDLEERLTRGKGADVIVTSGGVSVGDHDEV
jgi:molybdopterin molybdotransferase